jgi:hypothetical protein
MALSGEEIPRVALKSRTPSDLSLLQAGSNYDASRASAHWLRTEDSARESGHASVPIPGHAPLLGTGILSTAIASRPEQRPNHPISGASRPPTRPLATSVADVRVHGCFRCGGPHFAKDKFTGFVCKGTPSIQISGERPISADAKAIAPAGRNREGQNQPSGQTIRADSVSQPSAAPTSSTPAVEANAVAPLASDGSTVASTSAQAAAETKIDSNRPLMLRQEAAAATTQTNEYKRIFGTKDPIALLQEQNWSLRVRLVDVLQRFEQQNLLVAELQRTMERQAAEIAQLSAQIQDHQDWMNEEDDLSVATEESNLSVRKIVYRLWNISQIHDGCICKLQEKAGIPLVSERCCDPAKPSRFDFERLRDGFPQQQKAKQQPAPALKPATATVIEKQEQSEKSGVRETETSRLEPAANASAVAAPESVALKPHGSSPKLPGTGLSSTKAAAQSKSDQSSGRAESETKAGLSATAEPSANQVMQSKEQNTAGASQRQPGGNLAAVARAQEALNPDGSNPKLPSTAPRCEPAAMSQTADQTDIRAETGHGDSKTAEHSRVQQPPAPTAATAKSRAMFSGLSAGFLKSRTLNSGVTSNVTNASSEHNTLLRLATPSAQVQEALKQSGRDPKLPGTACSEVADVRQQEKLRPETSTPSPPEAKCAASPAVAPPSQQQQSAPQPVQQGGNPTKSSTESQEKQSSSPQPDNPTLAALRQPEALDPTGSTPKLPDDAPAGHGVAAEKSQSETGVTASAKPPKGKHAATPTPRSGCHAMLRRSQSRHKRTRARIGSSKASLRGKP